MNRLSPTHVLRMSCALLCCLLLDSCGTSFWKASYYVGVLEPQVANTAEKNADNGRVFSCDWKIHRIGPEYYAEMEQLYYPRKPLSDLTWDVFDSDKAPDPDLDQTPERRVRFCKLIEWERRDLKLPELPPAPAGAPKAPDELSPAEAAKLNPVYVCTKRCDYLPVNLDMADKHTWTHYAMLPVSGLTFVALDLPCDIIGTTGAAAILLIQSHIIDPLTLKKAPTE